VPDLDLAPISRPAMPRTSSGTRQAVVAVPLDLEELPADVGAGATFDLDLPVDDPLSVRRSSYPPPARSFSPPPVTLSTSGPSSARRPASVPAVRASVPATGTSLPPVTPAHAPATPAPAPAPGLSGAKARFELRLAAPADATLVQRLLPGGLLLGAAIAVTLLDQVYTMTSGEVFTLGPLRTSVLTGLVMVLGIGLCVYRLKRD